MQKIYAVGKNEKNDFYELWQQHKLLKTAEMNEAWPDTFFEGYIHQFHIGHAHKIQYQQQKHRV